MTNLLHGDDSGSDSVLVKNSFFHIQEGMKIPTPLKRSMSNPGNLSRMSAERHRTSWSKGQAGCELDGGFSSEVPSTSEGSSTCEEQDAPSWTTGSNVQGLELINISEMLGSAFGDSSAVPEPSWFEEEEGHEEGACGWNWSMKYIDISETLSSSLGDDCAVPGASWSVGAEEHEDGACKPCGWNWKLGGCSKGIACVFCHMCGPDELKKRRAERLATLKEKKKQRQLARALRERKQERTSDRVGAIPKDAACSIVAGEELDSTSDPRASGGVWFFASTIPPSRGSSAWGQSAMKGTPPPR